MLDIFADGRIDNFGPVGEQLVPLTTSYYLQNEGGVKDMKKWLGVGDSDVIQMRNAFISFLKTNFSIVIDEAAINAPSAALPENGVGGVVPYSGSHASGLRIVSSISRIPEKVVPAKQYIDQRLVEVGFKYWNGTHMWKRGSYVIENYKGDTAQTVLGAPLTPGPVNGWPVISFETLVPSSVSEVNQALIWESLSVTATAGDGRVIRCTGSNTAISIQYPYDNHHANFRFNVRGSFTFDACA